MFNERSVPLARVVAICAWTLTLLLILVGTVVGLAAEHSTGYVVAMSLVASGLACSAAAATVSIRCAIDKQNRLLRDAFNLGAESTKLRRIGS